MNRKLVRTAALIAAGLISLTVGALSGGYAQAAERLPHSSVSDFGSEVSAYDFYTAIETKFVFTSPSLTSKPVADILKGELVKSDGEIITDRFGIEFVYAWTYNYQTGHFFQGYVEADNLLFARKGKP